MGCNCGSKNRNFIYKYVSPTGKVSNFKTEVEAKAARIKNKGGSYTKVAK